MSPKLEILLKINVLNYLKSCSYLLKCIPRNFAYKQSISGPRNTFTIARLHVILSAAGSIILKGRKQKNNGI